MALQVSRPARAKTQAKHPVPARRRSIFDKPLSFKKVVFKKGRRVAVPKPLPVIIKNLPSVENLPTTVQGIAVGSKEEARVAVALNSLQVKYRFHVQLQGGHRLRRGLELDFLVSTKPLPTPILVQGSYWHTGIHADHFDTERINADYAGRYAQVVEMWDYDLTSVTAALSLIRKDGLAP
jgi:hypothetical protein